MYVSVAQEDLIPNEVYKIRKQIVPGLRNGLYDEIAQEMMGMFIENRYDSVGNTSIFLGTQLIPPAEGTVANEFLNLHDVVPLWGFWGKFEPNVPIIRSKNTLSNKTPAGGRRKRTHAKRKRRTLKKRRRTRRTR